jgi:hypothetical protein
LTKPTDPPLRIAGTGSAVVPEAEDTASAAPGRMLLAPRERGVEVDLYHPESRAQVPQSLRRNPKLVVVGEPVAFEWDRW